MEPPAASMGLRGDVAEWLGRGLQSLVQRFESARRLYRLVHAGLRIGLISQACFACGRNAREIRRDILGREVSSSLDRTRRLARGCDSGCG